MREEPLKAPKNIKKLTEQVASVTSEDDLDKAGSKALSEENLKNIQSARDLREKYANKLFWYLIAYSLLAYVLLLLHGFRVWGFALEPTVMAIVVGSTAASAITLVGVVAKGLFK